MRTANARSLMQDIRAQATMWREWHAGLDQLRPLNQYEIDTLGWLRHNETDICRMP